MPNRPRPYQGADKRGRARAGSDRRERAQLLAVAGRLTSTPPPARPAARHLGVIEGRVGTAMPRSGGGAASTASRSGASSDRGPRPKPPLMVLVPSRVRSDGCGARTRTTRRGLGRDGTRFRRDLDRRLGNRLHGRGAYSPHPGAEGRSALSHAQCRCPTQSTAALERLRAFAAHRGRPQAPARRGGDQPPQEGWTVPPTVGRWSRADHQLRSSRGADAVELVLWSEGPSEGAIANPERAASRYVRKRATTAGGWASSSSSASATPGAGHRTDTNACGSSSRASEPYVHPSRADPTWTPADGPGLDRAIITHETPHSRPVHSRTPAERATERGVSVRRYSLAGSPRPPARPSARTVTSGSSAPRRRSGKPELGVLRRRAGILPEQ